MEVDLLDIESSRSWIMQHPANRFSPNRCFVGQTDFGKTDSRNSLSLSFMQLFLGSRRVPSATLKGLADRAMSQSSRTPYDHLRYRYPETWRKLVSILDKEGAPVAMSPSGLVRPGGGFRIEGAHAGPSEASPTSTALSRTASDPAFLKWKQQDEQSVHTLRMMKKERRNPFGSWYEGSKVVEKIGGVASNDPCGTRKKPRERSGLRGGKGWTVVLGCVVSLSYIRAKAKLSHEDFSQAHHTLKDHRGHEVKFEDQPEVPQQEDIVLRLWRRLPETPLPNLYWLGGLFTAFWAYRMWGAFNRLMVIRYADINYQLRRPDVLANKVVALKFLALPLTLVPAIMLGSVAFSAWWWSPLGSARVARRSRAGDPPRSAEAMFGCHGRFGRS
ncbi:unnamed protein product [Durusdinium trenchii]|uniref:Uncharacterized protein n=1 Tax=Durusdinium trenchii TaxID=1381693 RepID=A0ABP0S5L8_9DINO